MLGMAGTGTVIDPDKVSAGCVAALASALGPKLVSVIAHGSWVHGDFDASCSDVDLLAVVRQDPTPVDVARLDAELAGMFARNLSWADRVEIGVITADAVRDVVHGTGIPHQTARLSPGEPLHLVPAELHRLLDWDAASRGRTLFGQEGVLPGIPSDVVRRAVLQHLANWPDWVENVHGEAGLAYAVLSVARADAYATTGALHSKRQGAQWLTSQSPEYAQLLGRAVSIWYRTDEPQPLSRTEVQDFVLTHAAARMAHLRPVGLGETGR